MVPYFTFEQEKTASRRQFWSSHWGRFGPAVGIWILALALLLPTPGMSANVSGDGSRDVSNYIPLAEITPGMTGYGLTVFKGATVDTFGVTVVGVQENVRVAGSLLLIEVSGHGLELSAIARGMSGSPIYLDGRFAGALAFGWGGALRPIAGVTPAAEMLAMPTDIPPESSTTQAHLPWDTASLLPTSAINQALAADLWGERQLTQEVVSATSPVTGWPDSPQMWLALTQKIAVDFPQLATGAEQWIFQTTTTAGQPDSATAGTRLVAGAACAVALVTGDAALGAIGTVTWVDGDQVLMMGHPFMQRGPVAWPLATAEVLTIFPSRQMSFKMGSVGQVLGTVHHDLRAGLVGRMGAAPRMVPVEVTIDRGNGESQKYEFKVAHDPVLTPNLVFWSIYNAILAAGDDASQQTLHYEITSEWSGARAVSEQPLVLRGVTAGPGGAAAMGGEIASPLAILLNNPFERVQLQAVRATIKQVRTRQTARVLSLTSPRAVAQVGEEIIFSVVIEPHQGPRETIRIPVTLPDHLQPGAYRVLVASAADLFALESQRAAGRFQPVNLGSLVEVLRTPRSRDDLVLAIFAPGEAAVVQGQELAHLPASVARTVRSGNIQVGRSLADYVYRFDQEVPWALSGHAVRSLRVQPFINAQKHERRP